MVMVKMLAGGREVAIIEDGSVYLFDLGGRFTMQMDSGVSKYMAGALSLPVLSVLSCNGKVEVGVGIGNSFKAYTTNLDAMTCAMTIQMNKGFLKMLRRDGEKDGLKFNQMFFVYREGFDINKILTSIGAVERKG